MRHLTEKLIEQGHRANRTSVGELLRAMGFSLQANVKTRERSEHPDRDAQFGYLNARVKAQLAAGQPVNSVDLSHPWALRQLERRERKLVVRYRILVGEQRHRPLGRTHRILNTPFCVCGGRRAAEVVRQGCDVRPGLGLVEALDRTPYVAMQLRPSGRVERFVLHLAGQRVREAKAPRAARELDQQPRVDRGREIREQRLEVKTRDLPQQGNERLVAYHRGDRQRVSRALGQHRDARADRLAHSWRQRNACRKRTLERERIAARRSRRLALHDEGLSPISSETGSRLTSPAIGLEALSQRVAGEEPAADDTIVKRVSQAVAISRILRCRRGRSTGHRPFARRATIGAKMATGSRLIKSAVLANGLKLPYVEQGDPSGVPVVFLHAFADSWRSFERLLLCFPRSIRAFAVTQRGHGDADRPAAGYGVEDFTADVGAFMDTIGLEAAVIVASSSASLTAQRFAAERPRRTLGLVFIGAPRSLRDKPGVAPFLDEVRGLIDPIDPAFVREFVETTVSGRVPPAFLETVIAENLNVPARVWKATLEGLVEAVPATETATITAPTVILWGDRDVFIPRSDQEALAAAIAGSRLVIYEGTGHVVHWEQPERVAADLVALLERMRPDQLSRSDAT